MQVFQPQALPIGPLSVRQLATVEQVIDWYTTHELREFSPVALAERRRLWNLFRAAFGHLSIDEAKRADLLDFIVAQKRAKSNWTKRRFRSTICKPFNEASQVGLISKNPFAGLRIPEGANGRDWTDKEYRGILRNSRAYFRRLIVFVRFSGARPGEARELLWSQIHEELDAIVQDHHKTSHATHEPRRIHFNVVLVKLLIWIRRHPADATHVFVNKFGRPWSIKALAKHLAMVRARAGLPKDVRCHGGRHTFATGALMRGVDIYTLSQLLGHRSVKTTERYLHLVHKRKHLNDAMNRAIGR